MIALILAGLALAVHIILGWLGLAPIGPLAISLGLVFDILGAATIVWISLGRLMASFKAMEKIIRREGLPGSSSWLNRMTMALAFRLGSKDVMATDPSMAEDLKENL